MSYQTLESNELSDDNNNKNDDDNNNNNNDKDDIPFAYSNNKNVIIKWFEQMRALLYKNKSIFLRSHLSTLFVIITPALFATILVIVAVSLNDSTDMGNNNKFTVPFKKCEIKDVHGDISSANSQHCASILYVPNTQPYSDVMKQLATDFNFEYNKDVIGYSDTTELLDNIADRMGFLHTIVQFVEGLNNEYSYSIWYNSTGVFSSGYFPSSSYTPTPPVELYDLQLKLDNIIISNLVPNSTIEHNVNYRMFDTNAMRIESDYYENDDGQNRYTQNASQRDTVVKIGGLYNFVTGVTVATLFFIHIIAREKQGKLLGAMRTMGLLESAYWLTWFLAAIIINTLSTLLVLMIGYSGSFSVFKYTNFMVHFLTLWFFISSMSALALFVSSFVTQLKWVNVACFMIFVLSIVLTSTLGFFADALYAPDASRPLLYFFSLMPWFHYSKCWMDILEGTQLKKVVNNKVTTFVQMHYRFSDMSKKKYVECDGDNCCTINPSECYFVPSTDFSLGMMVFLMCLYLILAWYFGQIFSSSQGSSKPFYFIFDPKYWGFTSKESDIIDGDTIEQVKEQSKKESSIRTHKLSKSFKNTTAVKELTLTVNKSECLALLGHNGAGKSTTINILSGLIQPTYGHAFIMGYDVKRDTDKLKSLMGQVPQDNILWPQLTCYEHVALYARLRHIPKEKEETQILNALSVVDLVESADTPSRNLSGGMQRRLCLATAIVGEPHILFLDECTTGMDPVNKHGVWRAIRKLKQDRIVLLTTHSMEEADFLGDQVAMMSGGRLRAVGTSLFLKNHFGSGYQLSLLTKPAYVSRILKQISNLLPSADVIDSSAGNITIGLPRKALPNLPSLFEWIEEMNKDDRKGKDDNKESKGEEEDATEVDENDNLLREWSISNSTLEEVFLRLCSSEKNVNEQAVDFKEDLIRMCEICNERESQTVTLFTKYGLGLEVSNIICLKCSQEEWNPEADKKKNEEEMAKIFETYNTHTTANSTSDEKDELTSDINSTDDTSNLSSSKDVSMHEKNNNDSDKESLDIFGIVGQKPTIAKQMKAIMLKNASLITKGRKANICRFILLLFGILMTWLVSSKGPSNVCPQGWHTEKGAMPCKTNEIMQTIEEYINNVMLNPSSYGAYWYNGTENTNLQCQGDQQVLSAYRPPQDGPGWGYYAQNSSIILPQIWSQAAPNGANIDQLRLFNDVGDLSDCTGTFVLYDTNEDIYEKVIDSSLLYKKHIQDQPKICYSRNNYNNRGWWFDNLTITQDHALELFPSIGVQLNKAEVGDQNINFDYTLLFYNYAWTFQNLVPTFQYIYYGDTLYCSYLSPFAYSSSGSDGATDSLLGGYFINALSNAITRTLKNDTNLQYISTFIAPIPQLQYPNQVNDGAINTALTWTTFVSMLFMPLAASRLVVERETKLLHMMRISGLDIVSYYLGNYVFDFIIIFIWMLLYVLMGDFFGSRVFTLAGWNLLFPFVLLWTLGQLGIATFIAGLLSKSGVTSIASYVVLVVMTVVVPILYSFLPDHSYTPGLLLLPPVSFARAAGLIFEEGGDTISSKLSEAFGYLFLGSILFFMVGLYLCTLHYLPATWIFDYVKRKRRQKVDNDIKMDIVKNEDYGSVNEYLLVNEDMDVDVRKEMKRVENVMNSKKHSNLYPVTVANLEKIYNHNKENEKRAVRGLSFAVEMGEVFGLLGPNGAGKSTTISIINGLEDASLGEAFVCGFSSTNEIEDVHTVLGVCPQFDCVWDELSVQEHLYFYGRLKGVSRQQESALVQQLAEMVELDGDAFNMKASELSGGMRRRLSIAISLIGNPKVWLLDEPSTGLSPEARRQIWNIVNKQKKMGRAVILTTHSMEEADTLCSRIGIMAEGRLECIGSQQHLKRRFGEGFRLSFNTSKDCGQVNHIPDHPPAESVILCYLNNLTQYVQTHLAKKLKFAGAFGKTISYVLPNAGTGAVELFSVVAKSAPELKKHYDVVEWSLTQSSLEEVFIRTVELAKEKANDESIEE